MDIAGAISDAIANLLRPAVKVLLEGMFGIINDSVAMPVRNCQRTRKHGTAECFLYFVMFQ